MFGPTYYDALVMPLSAPSPQGGVSAIVVSYRTGPVLKDCLEALVRQPQVHELIIIDNGNGPAGKMLIDQAAQQWERVRVIRPPRNVGFAAACNQGARASRAPYLAFVNPDLVVPDGAFDHILPFFTTDPRIWLCGGQLINPDGSEQRGSRREVLTPWRAIVEMTRLDRIAPSHPYFRRFHYMENSSPPPVIEVPTISGAFMVMPTQRFQHLGGMDERMFLHTEDIDLCLRTLLAGGKVLFCGAVRLIHWRGTSDAPRLFVEWHKTRSTARYFFKHFSTTYPLWSLHLVRALMWMRYCVQAVYLAPHDLRWLFTKGTRRDDR